jgi:hypothetical protein
MISYPPEIDMKGEKEKQEKKNHISIQMMLILNIHNK